MKRYLFWAWDVGFERKWQWQQPWREDPKHTRNSWTTYRWCRRKYLDTTKEGYLTWSIYVPKREKKHGKNCKQIEAILHLNIAKRFKVPSQPFLKNRERNPKLGKAERERAQCVALSSSRDTASLNCSSSAAWYKEGTKTVSNSKRNYGGLWGSGGTYALYLKIGSIWISMVCFTPQSVQCRGSKMGPIADQRVSKMEKYLTSAKNRTARNSL